MLTKLRDQPHSLFATPNNRCQMEDSFERATLVPCGGGGRDARPGPNQDLPAGCQRRATLGAGGALPARARPCDSALDRRTDRKPAMAGHRKTRRLMGSNALSTRRRPIGTSVRGVSQFGARAPPKTSCHRTSVRLHWRKAIEEAVLMARRGHGEGSIYQRSDGRWVARLTLEGGRRKEMYARNKTEARSQLRKAMLELAQGLLVTGPGQTLAQYLGSWLNDMIKVRVRPHTFESYSRVVRGHLVPALGKTPLAKLSAQQLQAYYALKLEEGKAPGSVHGHHVVLHGALKKAMRLGLVARNVADLVDPPQPRPQEMRPFSPEEARHFLDCARDDRLYALYCLAITAGMRQAEMLGLHWDDVDFEQGEVRVRRQLNWSSGKGFSFVEPKTAKGRRSVALPAFALEALRLHRRAQLAERLRAGPGWEEMGLVFPNESGRPLDRNNLVKRSFFPLLAKSRLPKIRFHDLRHTAATLLLCQGENPKVVQERLGHASVELTLNTYSHVLPNIQRAAAAKLDALFRSPGLLEAVDTQGAAEPTP